MSETNLLAYLAIHCRVYSISDLSFTPQCREIIKTMRHDMYPLIEWNDAVCYLCKRNDISFSSSKSAKEYLITHSQ